MSLLTKNSFQHNLPFSFFYFLRKWKSQCTQCVAGILSFNRLIVLVLILLLVHLKWQTNPTFRAEWCNFYHHLGESRSTNLLIRKDQGKSEMKFQLVESRKISFSEISLDAEIHFYFVPAFYIHSYTVLFVLVFNLGSDKYE